MEVGHYIRHRLKLAGYKGAEIFDFAAIEKISYYSGGILRKEKQEFGIDLVLSTKRKGDKTLFTIKEKPTTDR